MLLLMHDKRRHISAFFVTASHRCPRIEFEKSLHNARHQKPTSMSLCGRLLRASSRSVCSSVANCCKLNRQTVARQGVGCKKTRYEHLDIASSCVSPDVNFYAERRPLMTRIASRILFSAHSINNDNVVIASTCNLKVKIRV